MKLIKRKEQKLLISYELGTIEEKDNITNETVVYKAQLSNMYEPMIVFPNGDIAVITWQDIIDFAKFTKNNHSKEETHGSDKNADDK